MNQAVWQFRRYEDSSLSYTGINKHEGEKVGLFNTVVDYDEMFVEQQASLAAPPVDESDIPENPFSFIADFEDEEEEEIKPEPKKRGRKAKEAPITVTKMEPVVSGTIKTNEKSSGWHVPGTYKEPKPSIIIGGSKPAETVSFDESKVKKGVKVIHKAFGEGVIKSKRVDESGSKHVLVQFKDTARDLIYPFAFVKGFMKIDEE